MKILYRLLHKVKEYFTRDYIEVINITNSKVTITRNGKTTVYK